MEPEYTYLLHLLGAYLREEAPDPAGNMDWDALLALAQIHGVTGIVGYMGRTYPLCPDPQRKSAFRNLCMGTIALFARRFSLAQVLIQQLEQAGIDHILMKGYVLRDYFPVPELRTFTDIDLVIRPEDRRKSHELMLTLGFTAKDDWEPVFSYHRGSEYYEIHTRIMEIDVSEKADYRGYFDRAWDHARPVSDHSFRFTPEFHFLYLLTHIAKHIHGSGAGIRMYLDVAAFIQHHRDMDWRWVKDQLKELKLYTFARVVLCAVEHWFGIKCPMAIAPVSEETLDAFTEFTLEAGVFGHYNRNSALAQMKYEEESRPADRAKLLMRMAFPRAETIQSRYTYLQDKPWLLPVAWVHRFGKTISGTEHHLETARQIIRADAEEVKQLKKLMKDIGL